MHETKDSVSLQREEADLRNNALTIDLPKRKRHERSEQDLISDIRERYGVEEHVARDLLDRHRRLGHSIDSMMAIREREERLERDRRNWD